MRFISTVTQCTKENGTVQSQYGYTFLDFWLWTDILCFIFFIWGEGGKCYAVPEGLEGMVGNRHAGGEVQMLELGAELAEAYAGAVCDLGAAIQIQHFNVTAVLCKRPTATAQHGDYYSKPNCKKKYI